MAKRSLAKPDTLLYLPESGELELGNFKLTATGLTVNGKPTFEQWEQCGAFLRRVEGAVQFWIGDWINYGEARWSEKYSQALEVTGLEQSTLETYASVAKNVESLLRNKDLGFHIHKAVAPLPPAQQEAWLIRAADERMTVSDLRTAIRLERRREHYAAGDLPDGKFRVVYADPPWQYDDSGVIVKADAPIESDAWGRAERHYPTMSIEDLCALPLREHLDDDAVLFLWVTSPMLGECWPVLSAWGFTYKTSIIWDKRAHNYGHYVSVRHELLLIATRGSCTPDQPTPMPESVVAERRSDVHSEKPVKFRQIIEQLYPLGRKLELFGRAPVDGWMVYGNQLSTLLPVSA